MTFVKFCGMTREADVQAACDLGVNALGFVLWPKSPRYVDWHQLSKLIRVLAHGVTPIGVFVAPTADDLRQASQAGLAIAQLHGTVDPALLGIGGDNVAPVQVWRACAVDDDLTDLAENMTLLLDAGDRQWYGGTGRTIDWERASGIAARRRVVLAGGLQADNVARAIYQVRPFGVDVASGIEDRPGIKNRQAMNAFIAAVRKANE